MSFKRNEGKHTDTQTAIHNILTMMKDTTWDRGVLKSAMGYAAFQGYDFKWPQGAAFAVGKIGRKMEDAGLIRWNPDYGYYITAKGLEKLNGT